MHTRRPARNHIKSLERLGYKVTLHQPRRRRTRRELGEPRQFGQHGPDPDFDREAVGWIASALESTLAEVSLDSLCLPGQMPSTVSWTSC
jgi:hypothetical protein